MENMPGLPPSVMPGMTGHLEALWDIVDWEVEEEKCPSTSVLRQNSGG